MRWLWAFITHPVQMLTLVLAVLKGFVCSPGHKADCQSMMREVRAMIDTVVMDYGDFDVMLPPSTYCAGQQVDNIFAVPVENAVGTNDIDNAVSVLRFKNDEELDRNVVKKDFMEMVTGPFEFRFLPVVTENEIAYSQSRGFLLIDVPRKKVEIHTIIPGMYDIIGGLAVLDAAKRTFVFEINSPAAGIGMYSKTLRVVRFEGGNPAKVAERPAGLKEFSAGEPWFVYQKRIFVYTDSTARLDAFDERFVPGTHLLAEVFNAKGKDFRSLKELCVHPQYQFAIGVERGKRPTKQELAKFDSLSGTAWDKATDAVYSEAARRTLFLFRWTHPDPKQRLVPLISKAGSLWNSYNPQNSYDGFTFSPDGKWVVFRDHSYSSENPVFVAVPIDEKNPLCLGKPVKLGNAMRKGATGPTGTAWATDPTSFVMCDGLAIYRWPLGEIGKMKRVKMPPGAKAPF